MFLGRFSHPQTFRPGTIIMHFYVNFSPGDEKQVKAVVAEAASVMSYIATKVCGSNMDSCTRVRFQTWFGHPRDGKLDRVREVISRMATCLSSSTVRFKYKVGVPGTFAEALAGNKSDTYKQLSSETYKMTIYQAFFGLPRYADVKNNDVTDMDDSQMETFFHELSHLAGGTDDEDLDDGTKAYGASDAKLLITQDANHSRARNNADNYGFFCMAMGRYRYLTF